MLNLKKHTLMHTPTHQPFFQRFRSQDHDRSLGCRLTWTGMNNFHGYMSGGWPKNFTSAAQAAMKHKNETGCPFSDFNNWYLVLLNGLEVSCDLFNSWIYTTGGFQELPFVFGGEGNMTKDYRGLKTAWSYIWSQGHTSVGKTKLLHHMQKGSQVVSAPEAVNSTSASLQP